MAPYPLIFLDFPFMFQVIKTGKEDIFIFTILYRSLQLNYSVPFAKRILRHIRRFKHKRSHLPHFLLHDARIHVLADANNRQCQLLQIHSSKGRYPQLFRVPLSSSDDLLRIFQHNDPYLELHRHRHRRELLHHVQDDQQKGRSNGSHFRVRHFQHFLHIHNKEDDTDENNHTPHANVPGLEEAGRGPGDEGIIKTNRGISFCSDVTPCCADPSMHRTWTVRVR